MNELRAMLRRLMRAVAGSGLAAFAWMITGVRPIWQITDAFSLAFEGGVDWASSTQGGEGGTLGKLTIAPQVSLGNEYFSRPVLRAFFTYAMWTDGLQGEIGGLDYDGRTTGWSAGLRRRRASRPPAAGSQSGSAPSAARSMAGSSRRSGRASSRT